MGWFSKDDTDNFFLSSVRDVVGARAGGDERALAGGRKAAWRTWWRPPGRWAPTA